MSASDNAAAMDTSARDNPGSAADEPLSKAPKRPFSEALREFAGFPMPPKPTEAPKPEVSRFVPLTREAVVMDLCHDADADADGDGESDGDVFAQVALRLERHRHHDYRAMAREMRRLYLPSSPDADTLRVMKKDPEELARMQQRLAELVNNLLTRANYTRLDTDEISEILSSQAAYSLRIEVDLAEYDLLHVFVRDIYIDTHTVRRPETLFLLKYEYQIRFYRRLFIFIKLKSDDDRAAEIAREQNISTEKALKIVKKKRKHLPKRTSDRHVYIKAFKDMPEHDLQILFPLRIVQFRPFDKIKFFATAGGGTLFGIFSTTGKVLAATNPITAFGALFGFVGLLARQVTGFFNQRNRYMMELSQKLFFHNLANNRAALTLLLDRAEEEDVKEDLITLYFLAGKTVSQLELNAAKRKIEDTIKERYGAAIDFELDDALRRLLADGAVTENNGNYTFPTFRDLAEHYAKLGSDDDAADARHLVKDEAEKAKDDVVAEMA